MLLFDSLLITVWLSGLQIFFRFFYNSENLRLNSNKILLGVFTFEIIRHISIDVIQKMHSINFTIGLILILLLFASFQFYVICM